MSIIELQNMVLGYEDEILSLQQRQVELINGSCNFDQHEFNQLAERIADLRSYINILDISIKAIESLG